MAVSPVIAAPDLECVANDHGFALLGISDVDLSDAEPGLAAWLKAGYHGDMDYMARHGLRRARPAELVPGTVSVLVVATEYRPRDPDWLEHAWATLANAGQAYVSRYALGRDYHKVVRSRLAALVAALQTRYGPSRHGGTGDGAYADERADTDDGAGGSAGDRRLQAPTEPPLKARVFCDSAPVLEVELARRAGLGWRGKHTLLLNRQHGSMFFIGTVYLNRRLERPRLDRGVAPPRPSAKVATFVAGEASAASATSATSATSAASATCATRSVPAFPAPDGEHCGSCRRCMDVCPTQAIVAPYRLDARRCISYLTIENDGPIPEVFREAIGNRIYGCDDCQLVCPWNRWARPTGIDDFNARNGLDASSLVDLFGWSATEFDERMAGSAIRRIGHRRWRRNIAVALGNALRTFRRRAVHEPATARGCAHPEPPAQAHGDREGEGERNGERDGEARARDGVARVDVARIEAARIEAALTASDDDDPMVREHIQWALAQR